MYNVTSDYDKEGVIIYTLSDKVTPYFMSYSIITFYVSVVYVFGGFLRGALWPDTSKFNISEMPCCDKMLY